jgi:Kef-type K+ transport system membrane component KefB
MFSFDALLAVAVVAATAPLLAGVAPRLRIPAVVFEIVTGSGALSDVTAAALGLVRAQREPAAMTVAR